MIQKFYLHDSNSPDTGTLPVASLSGHVNTETASGAATNRAMDATIGVAQTSIANAATTQCWMRRFLSPPLGAQTVDGQWIVRTAGKVGLGPFDSYILETGLFVWRPSTGSKIATAYDSLNSGYLPDTIESIGDAGALDAVTSSITLQDGDILVLEVYFGIFDGPNTTNTFYYDGATEDSASDNASYLFAPVSLLEAGETPPASDPGFQRPMGLRITRRKVGPIVLRYNFRKPIPLWNFPEPLSPNDPSLIWKEPVWTANAKVGPVAMRRRKRLELPRFWSESVVGNNIFVTASDTLDAITDTAFRELQSFSRTASDSFSSLSDVANRVIALPRTASDSLSSLSDSAIRGATSRLRTASDSLGGLSDTAVRSIQSFTRTASDALSSLSDVANRLIALPRTAADSLATITESTVVQKGVTRTATDALSAISDSAVRSSQAFSRTASDALSGLSDSAVRNTQAFIRTASDTLNAITESTVVQKGISRTAADTINAISDSATRLIALPRTASDSLSALSDSAIRGATSRLRTASDVISGLSDTATRLINFPRTAPDALSGISDIATRLTARSRTASDALASISDSTLRQPYARLRTALDSLGSIIDSAIAFTQGLFNVFLEVDAITTSRDAKGKTISRDGGITDSRDGTGQISSRDQ